MAESEDLDSATVDAVARLLGRRPRGLRAVPVRRENGDPVVIRVASLVAGKPFPTLFWLVDAELNLRIDREEAGGLIARFQAVVDDSPTLQAAMVEDHREHISLRDACMTAGDKAQLQELGFLGVLERRGIGGIEDFRYIRCLHTWYAAHLIQANTIGGLLDAHWSDNEEGPGSGVT
ncbi:MAG: DUF501 domain-containing protein [Pseudomonadota bacterium]